jgi:hypothetical protein
VTARLRSSGTAGSSLLPRRNGFAESSIGPGSQARRSDTVLMKLAYRSATSISSLSIPIRAQAY